MNYLLKFKSEKKEAEDCNIDNSCRLEPIDLDDEEAGAVDVAMETLIEVFCDDRIEFAMNQYKDDGMDLSLFLIMFLIEKHPISEYFPNLLKAIYRYHERNPHENIEDYFTRMLNQAAAYLSSSENINALRSVVDEDFVIEPFDFLDLVIAEMGYENCGISPFKIDKLGEIAASFVNRAEQDSYFTESKDKMNKIEKYKEKLR